MRIWGKIWKDNHLLKDTTIEDHSNDTRTHKIFHALDEICLEFDLGKPIWLDSCVADFRKHSRNFMSLKKINRKRNLALRNQISFFAF